MKKSLIRTLTLTAAALTLGTAAYAQTRLIAEVPFSFRVNGSVLPAGNYDIGPSTPGTLSVLKLADRHSHKSALVLANGANEGEKGRQRLIFRCGDVTGCALIQAWAGSSPNHG